MIEWLIRRLYYEEQECSINIIYRDNTKRYLENLPKKLAENLVTNELTNKKLNQIKIKSNQN